VAIQHGDEPVRAGRIHVRAHGACGDPDADREPVVFWVDGQHDTGEWAVNWMGFVRVSAWRAGAWMQPEGWNGVVGSVGEDHGC
jgi:hypothetical protein